MNGIDAKPIGFSVKRRCNSSGAYLSILIIEGRGYNASEKRGTNPASNMVSSRLRVVFSLCLKSSLLELSVKKSRFSDSVGMLM
jgi:hypothetical protein